AVIDGVDVLVVVVVVRRPADADRLAVSYGGRRRIETRLSLSLPGRLVARHMRNRLIAVSGLHCDIVNLGSNVFGQVVQQDVVNPRSGTAGRIASRVTSMEHRLPLHETRRRNIEFGAGR